MSIAETLHNGDGFELPESGYIDREFEQLRRRIIKLDPESVKLSTITGMINWLLGPNDRDLSGGIKLVDQQEYTAIAASIQALKFLDWSKRALDGIGCYYPAIPADSVFHREVNQQFLYHLKNYLTEEKGLMINPDVFSSTEWGMPVSGLEGSRERLITYSSESSTTVIDRSYITYANNRSISGIVYEISQQDI